MQYTQLKQLVDIDNQITNLHKELSNLYAIRSNFHDLTLFEDGVNSIESAAASVDPWVIHTYAMLSNAWSVHKIDIPSLTILAKKLAKAQKIIQAVNQDDSKVGKHLGILLVPPDNIMQLPFNRRRINTQTHIALDDYIDPEVAVNTFAKKNSWQLLVAHTSATGLQWGSAVEILKHNKYNICGYDANAMGLRQYVALSLQLNKALDVGVWNMLLHNQLPETKQVLSVTFLNGQYRFELDEPNSILGDERFRPAIEIRGN